MPVKSLLEMCQRKAKRNSQTLEHLGDYRMTYRLARPILLEIKSPDQLRRIEENSPQIRGETGELWLNFIKRDIPDWQNKKHEPINPENWWKVYRKLKNEADAEEAVRIEGLEANLRDKNAKSLAEFKPRTAFEFKPTLKQKWAEQYFTGKRVFPKSQRKLGVLEKIKRDVKSSRNVADRQQQLLRNNFPTTVTRPPPQFVEEIKKREELAALRSPKKPASTFVSALDAGMRQDAVTRTSPSKHTLNSSMRTTVASYSQPVTSQRSTQSRDIGVSTTRKPVPSNRSQTSPPHRNPPQVERITASSSARGRDTISVKKLAKNARTSEGKHRPIPRSKASPRPGSPSGSQSEGSPKPLPIGRKRKHEPEVFLPPPKKRFVPASSEKLRQP